MVMCRPKPTVAVVMIMVGDGVLCAGNILVVVVGSTNSSRGAVDMDRSGVNGLVETVSEDTVCMI